MKESAGRDLALEGLRGYAACVVVAWHILLGFFPERSGLFESFDAAQSLRGSFYFGIINGSAAVALFFVLSGYVLTASALRSGDTGIIVRNAVKRWPRLAGPVVMVTTLSFLLFQWKFYAFVEAAAITRSPWLHRFAFAYETPFRPSLEGALWQGLYATFFTGQSHYDSSLWTMRYEFYGSFMAFGLALLLMAARQPTAKIFLIGIAILLAHHVGDPWYVAFPVGVGLAVAFKSVDVSLRLAPAAALLAIALWLLGHTNDAPRMAWFTRTSETLVWIFAAVLILVAIRTNDWVRSLFAHRIGQTLGRLSFPLYLVHVPVLCSLGAKTLSWTHLQMSPEAALWAAVATTCAGSVSLAAVIALLNERWLSVVNRLTPLPVGSTDS